MCNTLDDLLSQWEEGYQRGVPPSPESLCVEHPELLNELKSQIEALRAIESNFGNVLGNTASASEEVLRQRRLSQPLVVSSEFKVDRLHASGGLGEVYVASEPILQRKVAIKFPRKERLTSQQLARFEREAQITGRLNHPGIVPVYSLKQDDPRQPCYVMRFVDGATLRQRVDQLSQAANPDYFSGIEFRQLLHSFITLCNIVAYAHEQGVIHRDIKPENVILGPFGETMLMDWGLAKVVNEPASNVWPIAVSNSAETVTSRSLKTVDGQVLGTPAYASPEQLQGRVDLTDCRSDIYSLGATLYFLVCGTVDRSSQSLDQMKHSRGLPVPKRLAAICRKALLAMQDDRYQSAIAIREDVECYLAGEPISVVRETVSSRLLRAVRRRPGLAATVLASLSVAIIVGSVGGLLLNQKNRELSLANQQLSKAIAETRVAENRSKSTTDILRKGLFAATPDVDSRKDRSLREFLDEVSSQLEDDDALNTPEPLVVADTHTILTEAYLSLGLLDSSQKHADLAHEIYSEVLGGSSAEAITAQAHRGLILSHKDQDEMAFELSRQALELGRTLESLDAESKVALLDIHAHVCSQIPSPDHSLIISLHGEAYKIAVATFGANHRETLKIRSNVATALMDAGHLDEAKQALKQTYEAHVEHLGPKHPETLVDILNLIALDFKQGDFQSANRQCLANLDLFETVLTPEHPRVLRLRLLLAQTWAQLGDFEAAAKEARTALERTQIHLGPIHKRTFEARGILASACIGSGNLDEGKSLAEEQYRIAMEAFGPMHQYTIQAVTLLFDLAEVQGDIDAMGRWLERLRGTEWEAPAEEMFKAAREKIQK